MAFVNTTAPAQSFFSGISFARVGRAFTRGLRKAQIARMRSVMAQMPDAHLHAIGITRSETADYAQMLILRDTRK